MHQHGDVMRTVVAAALKADFADGVAVRQGFFQHLSFLQEAEAIQLCSDLCASVEEGFAGGYRFWGWVGENNVVVSPGYYFKKGICI